MDDICPTMINGSSTGQLPIHDKIIKLAIISLNRVCVRGRNVEAWLLELCSSGIVKRIRTDETRAITPPSLLGIERKMA